MGSCARAMCSCCILLSWLCICWRLRAEGESGLRGSSRPRAAAELVAPDDDDDDW
jgi:hypothetical protein